MPQPEPSQRHPRIEPRRSAILALLLLAPVPSLGTAMAMVIAPGPVGQTVFVVAKIWLLALPALWWLVVERGRPSWSPARQGGLGVGAALGVAVGLVILGAFFLLRSQIDPELMRAAVRRVDLDSPAAYLTGAGYWILVNSLLEEYVYRWFVYTRFERLMPWRGAVLASAAVFTAHHVIALGVYLDPILVIVASAGVFVGGAVWAWCYHRYRSIWPGWVCHIVADIAVFAIGWELVFGG
jgi:membrane protease YdiL (CAAX protease family)